MLPKFCTSRLIIKFAFVAIIFSGSYSVFATMRLQLPIEVFGVSGSQKSVTVYIHDPTQITHIYIRCNSCGYHDQRLDNNMNMVKATVSINGQTPISLKHYTGSGKTVGNKDIDIIGPEKFYGGIGGGFRTARFMVPVSGLHAGNNTVTFTHQNIAPPSMGFRVIEINFLENGSVDRKVLRNAFFEYDNPAEWMPPFNDANSIAAGRRLWMKRDHLYDLAVANLRGTRNGNIKAGCADCHAQDGRDLKYFNFSNLSIIERSKLHGLSRHQGELIASYIRSLDIPVVPQASPWNPPYQPGEGIDNRTPYRWAAGAGLDAVLERDAAMHDFLFPKGIQLGHVKDVVDKKATLNMRELPISIALPDWNQWLPLIHPDDALKVNSSEVQTDLDGNRYNEPFYKILYERAKANPNPNSLGELLTEIGKWSAQNADCFSAGGDAPSTGPATRALNGNIWKQSLAFKAPNLNNCSRGRLNQKAMEPVEIAKRGLYAWITVKYWELIHSNNLEAKSANLNPIDYHGETIDVSEKRGWMINSLTVFNRAPHYISHRARKFVTQDNLVGAYDTSAWYHLNMVLNSGYRQTMPSHFIYTLNWIDALHAESDESQSYRYWASVIKMRQLQTNGRYGQESGLDLRTAQPYFYYSNKSGDTSLRNVGAPLWSRLITASIEDLVEDAKYATAEDWANARSNSEVQPRNSANFRGAPNAGDLFDNGPLQGRNTYRLLPLLREQGIPETTLQRLVNWGKAVWPRGPWQRVD